METYVCGNGCSMYHPRLADVHEDLLLDMVTRSRNACVGFLTKAAVEKNLLKDWTLQMHQACQGMCFTKEMVLEVFSELVMKHNAWTYITSLPGVTLHHHQQHIYVPSVIRYGVQEMFDAATAYFDIVEPRSLRLRAAFDGTEFDLLFNTNELVGEIREPDHVMYAIDATYCGPNEYARQGRRNDSDSENF